MRAGATERIVYVIGAIASLILIAGSLSHRLPLDMTEVLGFVSGGWGVWLTVKENIWNWPIGIANSAFFLVLFLRAHLFADSSLQAIYIVLGILGWYWWLRGGERATALPIAHVRSRTAIALVCTLIVATVGLTGVLIRVHDAAPFWDALTTVLSLIAQYMLTRKWIENWWLWATADIIYIALYAYKGLALTSLLYILFFAMCIAGLRRWQETLSGRDRAFQAGTARSEPVHVGARHV